MPYTGSPLSRGCKVCRNRKIKCDETWPECNRCRRAGWACPGMRTDPSLVWRDENDVAKRQSEKAAKVRRLRDGRDAATADTEAGTITSSSIRLRVLPPSPSSTLLDRDSNHRSSLLTMLQSYCSWSPLEKNHRPWGANWFASLCRLVSNDDDIRAGLSAVVHVRQGQLLGDPAIIQRGRSQYHLAVRALQQSLSDPQAPTRAETHALCQLIFLYDWLEDVSQATDAWLGQADGMARLLELGGPQAYQWEPNHSFFVAMRQTAIICALFVRRPTFLADQEWMTVPWTNIPKDGVDYLLDIAVQIPAILRRQDLVSSQLDAYRFDEAMSEQTWIGQECDRLHRALRIWSATFKQHSSLALYDVRPRLLRHGDDTVFPETYDFSSMSSAHIHVLHWSYLLVLLKAREQNTDAIYRRRHSSSDDQSSVAESLWTSTASDKLSSASSASSPPLVDYSKSVSPPASLTPYSLPNRRRTFSSKGLGPLPKDPETSIEVADCISQSMEYFVFHSSGLDHMAALSPIYIALERYHGVDEAKFNYCAEMLGKLQVRGSPFKPEHIKRTKQ